VIRHAALVCSLSLMACGAPAREFEDNLFKVVGNGCRAREFVQSGFRIIIAGQVGIVTSLHGVVGCRSVSAENRSERVAGLYLELVDVSRDVAFLSSDTLRTDRSLRATAGQAPLAGTDAVAIRELVTMEQVAALTDRRSPRPEVLVLRRSDGSRPPDFGAPMLDATGAIVGVENGLAGETGTVGWVVAYRSIEWIPPVQDETEVDRLASLSTPLW
jgi:hypothetical protein